MSGDRYRQIRDRVARYCAMGERSPKQAQEKLLKYGLNPSLVEKAIEELQKNHFLDTERFAKAFANDKFRFNSWGKIKIRIELKNHLIPEDDIETGLLNIDQEEYFEKVEELIRKKWSTLKEDENYLVRKNKTASFLVRKGFESELVFNKIDDLMSSGKH
jgi:regulatory protein